MGKGVSDRGEDAAGAKDFNVSYPSVSPTRSFPDTEWDISSVQPPSTAQTLGTAPCLVRFTKNGLFLPFLVSLLNFLDIFALFCWSLKNERKLPRWVWKADHTIMSKFHDIPCFCLQITWFHIVEIAGPHIKVFTKPEESVLQVSLI